MHSQSGSAKKHRMVDSNFVVAVFFFIHIYNTISLYEYFSNAILYLYNKNKSNSRLTRNQSKPIMPNLHFEAVYTIEC